MFDFATLSGSFADVIFPTLGHGLPFDTSSLLTTGTIAVVPEPTTAMLIGVMGLIALHRRR